MRFRSKSPRTPGIKPVRSTTTYLCSTARTRRGSLAVALLSFVGFAAPAASAQALVNGGIVSGSISPAGDVDIFTFQMSAGQTAQLRVADTGPSALDPRITVRAPNGDQVTTHYGTLVGAVGLVANLTGTYTAEVDDGGTSVQNTGSYEVHYARFSGANEHGTLSNGGTVSGTIDLGDLDTFTFSAVAGESIQVRVAETAAGPLDPSITVYDPTGSSVGTNYGGQVGALAFVPAISGTYSLLVQDGGTSAPNTGPYEVHYARFPSVNENGALINAGTVNGDITLGDMDTFVFGATAGTTVQLRVVETAPGPFDPSITVYDPTGSQVSTNYGGQVGALAFVPSLSGTYTALIQDGGTSFPNTGPYEVHYAGFPGANEHGTLVNGGIVTGDITLGDLDTYIFDATAGETVQLRVAETAPGPLDPSITVYDPNGAQVSSNYGSQVGAIAFSAALTGTYSLLVNDGGTSTPNTGPYEVHFVRKPSANEHGALINGGTVSGFIDLGDLDTFVFPGTAGQTVQLRVAELAPGPLDPSITVYDPTGAQVGTNYGGQVGALAFVPALSGNYTLLVQDGGTSVPNTGPYEVHFASFPGAKENGSLVNGGTVTGSITLGDLDTFVFGAAAGQTVQLRVAETAPGPLDPSITVYDPNGASVASSYGGQVGAIAFVPALTGTYSLLVQDGGTAVPNTGPYEVHYAKLPGANEHGQIATGSGLSGTITLGDLDTFTMTINAGAPVVVRATESALSPLDPSVTVYGPTGSQIGTHSSAVSAQVAFIAPTTGTYSVLVQDGGTSFPNVGAYGLQMEGGAGQAYCFGDSVASNCPCGATGNAGEGCANSSGTQGALLGATGSALLSNDSFQLHASGLPGAKPGLILRGANQLNGSAGNPVGDGLLCTGGNSARSQVQVTANGSTTFSHFLGGSFGASCYGIGVPTNYQFWYRDPQNSCSGTGFNFSNAWTVTWLP